MDATRPIDAEHFSFTSDGPWVVDPERLVWRRGLDVVRAATRREAITLARPPKAPPVRRVLRTSRLLGGAVLLWWLREKHKGGTTSRAGISRRLRLAFEHLGPTYIKLGQILSAGEGIFPPELVEEFRLCRDEVKAQPFDHVREVVEEDLGSPLEEVFSTFDREPIAAASIAQVHGAVLRTGEPVVVKVQRRDVAGFVRLDLAAMAWVAPRMVGRIPVAALANPPSIVELFADTIVEELDFRLEAENMLDIGQVLAETDQRTIVVPRPHPELVTKRVLVMERLGGFAFHDVESMRAAGVDTKAVIRAGMVSTLEGSMLYGVFHGDLHGGNLFVDENGRVSLLDFGITGRLNEQQRLAFIRMLMGAMANDIPTQIAAMQDLGALPKDIDVQQLIADLGLDRPPKDPTQMSADELVQEIRDIVKALIGYGARMPKELMLFVKNLLFLDGAIATLAPDLDLIGETFQIATYFAQRHGERLAADVGAPQQEFAVNLDGFKASFGLDPDVESLTYEELTKRRAIIRERFEERRAQRRWWRRRKKS
jgi:ubiquinone biosynthesis protein